MKTAETIARLEHVFGIGSSIAEVCLHAGIGERTYNYWTSEDDGFSQRMGQLRETSALMARKEVFDAPRAELF